MIVVTGPGQEEECSLWKNCGGLNMFYSNTVSESIIRPQLEEFNIINLFKAKHWYKRSCVFLLQSLCALCISPKSLQ